MPALDPPFPAPALVDPEAPPLAVLPPLEVPALVPPLPELPAVAEPPLEGSSGSASPAPQATMMKLAKGSRQYLFMGPSWFRVGV